MRVVESLRRQPTRIARTLVVITAIVVGMIVVPASPALAACSGSGCNGADPESNCSASEKYDAAPYWGEGFSVILRGSSGPGCIGFWAKGTLDGCYGMPPMYSMVERQIRVWTPYGYSWGTINRYYQAIPCRGSAWTAMVGNYDVDRARACAGYSYDGRSPAEMPDSWWAFCTAWV